MKKKNVAPFVALQVTDRRFELDGFDHFTGPQGVQVCTAVGGACPVGGASTHAHIGEAERLQKQVPVQISEHCNKTAEGRLNLNV